MSDVTAFADLERALTALGPRLAFPSEPNLAPQVRAAIDLLLERLPLR